MDILDKIKESEDLLLKAKQQLIEVRENLVEMALSQGYSKEEIESKLKRIETKYQFRTDETLLR